MSAKDSEDPKNVKASQPSDEGAPYGLGYRQPPAASRFKPGKSGNPKGRPKGSARFKTGNATIERLDALVIKEAYRPIQIRDGGITVKIPVIQAALRSLALNAAKGKQRAQRMLLDLAAGAESERRRDRENLFEAVVDYKISCATEIALARRRGLPEPVLLPRPDHLIVDPLTGSVISCGPWTEEEKAHWDTMSEMKGDIVVELGDLEDQLSLTPDDEMLQKRIEIQRRVLARINRVLGAERVILAGGR